MKAAFLNVDLDIDSASRLHSLAAAMGKRVFVVVCGPLPKSKRHLLRIESARQHRGPDAAIHALCSAVEKLPPAARRIWAAACKEFNIGCESRLSEQVSQFALRPDTIERVAALGASLGVTYYRREAGDD